MDDICAFEIGRGADVDLSIALARDWAAPHSEAEVVFQPDDVLGWHCALADGAQLLLSFPWYDDVDRMLKGEAHSDLPTQVGVEGWDDLEQGWWASIVRREGQLYLAEADFDELLRVPGHPQPTLHSAGVAEFGGVTISWNVVPNAAYEAAWRTAAKACREGSPNPLRETVWRRPAS